VAAIRLIAGLGNPGREHERDRHNAGFWLVERYARASGLRWVKEPRFKGLTAKASGDTLLVLPQTYMNRSGQSVVALARFFKIAPEETLVVHDELDFPPGTAKLKPGGGVAGHNGLKDIAEQFGTPEFWRLRIGIGHPGDRDRVSDWVLSTPSPDDRREIEAAIDQSLEVMPAVMAGDLQGAMLRLHGAMNSKGVLPAAAPGTPSGTGPAGSAGTRPSEPSAGGGAGNDGPGGRARGGA
jgi:PTH1 family peptidyl-tRNA hydrolase